MIIIGIDPGSLITGYGIIEVQNSNMKALDFGCIKPPASLPLSQRNKIIFQSLQLIISKYSIDVMSIETPFVAKNPHSALIIGMSRSIAILAATLVDIPVFEYSPTQAKLAAVGKGRGSKSQVQRMVQVLLSLSSIPEPADAADALALAICHIHHAKNPISQASPC